MFWRKKKENGKPTAISGSLGRLIAGELSKVRMTGDHWVKYLVVSRSHSDDKGVVDVRIFDEWCATQKKVKVNDFSSLDAHPDLIVMEGWYAPTSKKGDIRAKVAA
jgi:hypothetical protein